MNSGSRPKGGRDHDYCVLPEGGGPMSDYIRKMFFPTRQDIIEGYEIQIERKEQDLQSLRAYVRTLKGQVTLDEVTA